jgi:nucleotide-binding universal stress UspA family protein
MYKHILIATDGSELGAKAVDQGLDLAKQLGAKVTAITVTVTEPWTAAAYGTIPTPTLIKVYDKAAADNAARILASVSDVAKKKQIACDALHVKDHYAADGIIDTAEARGCDLIVMASHGRRGLARVLLGSETTKVLTLSPIPVLVCR